MDRTTWGAVRSCVIFEIRVELGRLGLAKEDFERRGVTVDGLDREVLRLFIERGQGQIAGIVSEILARIGLGLSSAGPTSKRA
jgi:hypothetical protein